LAALFCLFFALRRQVLGSVVTFLIALAIHPINVFLLPILLGPAGATLAVSLARSTPGERKRQLGLLGGALVALAILVVAAMELLVPIDIREAWHTKLLPGIGTRLIDGAGWLEFAARYSDLLTGTTIYRYIAGPVPEWMVWLQRGLFGSLLLVLLVVGGRRLYRERDHDPIGLIAGIAVSLVGFYLLLGLPSISPSLERYAMFLVTPSCLALAILWKALALEHPQLPADAFDSRQEGAAPAEPMPAEIHPSAVAQPFRTVFLWTCLLLTCGLLLAGFYVHYFEVLLETGGLTHRTFRTAAIEPKQATFSFIATQARGEPVTILAEDWWTHFPLYYLAGDRPDYGVVFAKNAAADTASHRRFVVCFAGSPCDLWLKLQAGLPPPVPFNDYANRPVLHVWDLGQRTDLLPGLASVAATISD
jgi:hypothetical protein